MSNSATPCDFEYTLNECIYINIDNIWRGAKEDVIGGTDEVLETKNL